MVVIVMQLTAGALVGTEQQHSCTLPCEHADVHLHLDTTLLPGEVTFSLLPLLLTYSSLE